MSQGGEWGRRERKTEGGGGGGGGEEEEVENKHSVPEKMTFHVDLAGAEFDGSLKRAAENPRSEINGLRLERDTKPAVAYKNTWLRHGGEGDARAPSPRVCSLTELIFLHLLMLNALFLSFSLYWI